MKIPITNNWMQELENVIGYVEFADTAKANFFYEMLKMRPDSFRFEIGYIKHDDGKYELVEVSLVSKHPKYHPIIVKRRLADLIRRNVRRIRNAT